MFESLEGNRPDDFEINDEDNLGNNPDGFVSLENISDEGDLAPDQILIKLEKLKKKRAQEEGSSKDVLIDNKNETSNWEADVEARKYDNYKKPIETKVFNSKPVHTSSRNNIVEIGDMKRGEKMDKYWDASRVIPDNAKRKDEEIHHDSIRFDDAV